MIIINSFTMYVNKQAKRRRHMSTNKSAATYYRAYAPSFIETLGSKARNSLMLEKNSKYINYIRLVILKYFSRSLSINPNQNCASGILGSEIVETVGKSYTNTEYDKPVR